MTKRKKLGIKKRTPEQTIKYLERKMQRFAREADDEIYCLSKSLSEALKENEENKERAQKHLLDTCIKMEQSFAARVDGAINLLDMLREPKT